jgi:putative transposase
MQQLGSSYARHVNQQYSRTGTLWEGRFRSSPVDSDYYCLACYRYIELNPVRAGIVAHPKDYRWTSYHENVGQRALSIVAPHASFLAIASSIEQRIERYQAIVGTDLPETTVMAIRHGI